MNTLQVGYRKRSILSCLQSFPQRLKYITVERAAELLVKMGRGNEKIWWASVHPSDAAFAWTANQFMRGDTKANCADHIRVIEFYGGPPGIRRLCKGTFLTYLMDRLLIELQHGGFTALDAIIPLQENYASNPRQHA